MALRKTLLALGDWSRDKDVIMQDAPFCRAVTKAIRDEARES
jgi:hypothetical protein